MINILYACSHVTMDYAAKELKKYLDKVTGTLGFAKIKKMDALPAKAGEGEILLGFLSDFGLSTDEVEDPMLDDVIDVKIEKGTGYIAGSNERSILFGVYDYFKSMGCLWVRPGPMGEHIVSCDVMKHDFVYHKKADVRFRGECLEGSPSYEHIRATITFAPKVHMNLFMMENIVPYNYMSRWYRHSQSTFLPNEDIGYEGCKGLIERLEKDLEMVGLHSTRSATAISPRLGAFTTTFPASPTKRPRKWTRQWLSLRASAAFMQARPSSRSSAWATRGL